MKANVNNDGGGRRITSFRLIATMYPPSCAGFYTSLWGPVPYSFGDAFDESFIILTAATDTSLF